MIKQARTINFKLVKMIAIFALSIFVSSMVIAPKLRAQNTQTNQQAEEDKSWFLTFIEEKLSTPNRKIVISDISGALSSTASIGSITVADRQGIWLKISQAELDWNRLALLRGHISVNSLKAQNIDIYRKPLPDTSLTVPDPEANGFSLPELPVAIEVGAISADTLTLGKDLIGVEASVSLDGYLKLANGALNSKFDVKRLDSSGGFDLIANFSNKTGKVKINLDLNEPANGIASNLLKIDGRPALTMSVKGDGNIDNLNVKVTMNAATKPVIDGNIIIKKDDKGRNIGVNFSGPFALLLPEEYRSFFGDRTSLNVQAAILDAGGFILHSLIIDGNAIKVKAMAQTTNDGFLRNLNVNAQLANENGGTLILPIKGAKTTINNMSLNIAYGTPGSDHWDGKLVINQFKNAALHAGAITINMGGLAQNLDDPLTRHVTILAQGEANNIDMTSAQAKNALGDKIVLDVDVNIPPKNPINIQKFDFSANGLLLFLKGQIDHLVFNGDIGLKAQSLAPFSAFTGRPLAGSSDLIISGDIGLITGTGNITVNGKATGIKTGSAITDRLLASQVIISGGIGRDKKGLHARSLKIANKDFEMSANGNLGRTNALMDFNLNLSNLKLINPQISGGASIKAALRGHNSFLTIGANASIQNALLQGRKLENFNFSFNGILDNTNRYQRKFSGFSIANGRFDHQILTLNGAFQKTSEGLSLDNLSVNLGKTSLTGSLIHTVNGFIDGKLHVNTPDIAPLAALALLNGKGQALADITLSSNDGKQNVTLLANAKNIDVAGNQINNLDANIHVIDLMGVPQAEGTLTGRNIIAGRIAVNEVNFSSTIKEGTSHFSTNVKLANKTQVDVGGALKAGDKHGWQLALDHAQIYQDGMNVKLIQPTNISLSDSGEISIEHLLLAAGGGKIGVNGKINGTINMDIDMNAFPLSVANMVMPELAAHGMMTGRAKITGPKTKPSIAFNIKGDDLSAALGTKYGLPPLTLAANGNTNGDILDLSTHLIGDGLNVAANGSMDLNKQGLDLDLTLTQFPIGLANTIVKGQNLAGQVVGNAHIGGTFKSPTATFKAQATSISTTMLSDNGLAPIAINVQGAFNNNIATLETLEINGPAGLQITAMGSLPISGADINLKINGSAPLALGNRFLAKRGSQLSGTLNINASVAGNIKKPNLGGNFDITNGQFLDPITNIHLTQLALTGTLNGETVNIANVSARSANGGNFKGSGTITIDIAQGMPSDINIDLNHLGYNDNNMIALSVNGNLTAKGPLMRDIEIGGDILIEKAEIRVPDKFGGATQIDVQHKNTSKAIEQTIERAGIDIKPKTKAEQTANKRVNGPKMNLLIRAPKLIFVRGRGLDTELGGSLRLTGPINDIHPIGGFNLIRGRLDILTQRLTFEQGQVTMAGNFNPDLNFVATSQSNDTVVTVTVKGTPSDLNINFSSQPELPQDEVLARLIFNRSISELSPFQIAQLAAAAAELAGLTNNSLMTNLRSATGLDDLDIVTDNKGNTGVRAGRYLRNNVYLGVEAGSSGTTKGTINLDISRHLKTKGALGTDSNSSVGVFYEKDY